MTITPLDFGVQSNPGRYGPDNGARLINAYVEQADPKGKKPFPIYCIEGMRSFATLAGGSRTRGAISLDPNAYVVSGPILYKVNDGGTATVIGGFPGGDPVFMARNRKTPNPQIALVSQGLRYICSGDVLTSIADTDLPNANSVVSIAGYFVFTIQDGRFFWTSIDEGTAIDALDFASAEANPDGIQVAYAYGNQIALFGTHSIEFWALTEDTSPTAAPFARVSGSTIQNLGCLCQHSVKDLNDVPFFVASDGTVRMLEGYQPQVVSIPPVERAIDGVENKASITATAYSIRGHQFYCLSAADWTWVYDGKTSLWHERQSYGHDRWRGEVFVDINGKRVVGDHEDGLLYEIDPDTYTEAGEHLVWKIRSPPMHAYPSRLIVDRLFLDTIPGTGLNSSDDHASDPQVMMRYSDDGSATWSNERTAATGGIGAKRTRVKFEQLGETGEDGRVWEVSMSAPVIRGLTGAAVDVEPLEP